MITPTQAQQPPASWVIRERITGRVLFETFDPKKVARLNTAKYEAVPILEYLQSVARAAQGGR